MTIAVFSSFMTPFMISAINIALPSIEKEFQLDAVLLSWVAASFLLAASVFLVPFGRLADIYGRKKTFVAGIAFFTFSSLWCAFSTSASVLLFASVHRDEPAQLS